MRTLPILVMAALAIFALPSGTSAQDASQIVASASPISTSELDAVRAATEKYRDVNVALADGYVLPADMCITSVMEGQPRQLGSMGLHYVHPELLGITGQEPRVAGTGTHTDFTRPAVLIYEPRADGSQELVAVENLVWAGAWAEAGNSGPPSFMGNDYFYMHDNPETEADEAHGFEPHWELHVWLYRDNPTGMFSPFNPTVTCEHHAAHPES